MFSAILLLLNRPFDNAYLFSYDCLSNIIADFNVVIPFFIIPIVAHSIAGSISKKEIKTLLSYPVQKWQLFLSKFLVLFLAFCIIYCGTTSLQLPLLQLSIIDPVFLVSLFVLILQLFFICTITATISVITKNETISIIASALLLYGIDAMFGRESLFSSTHRMGTIFNWVRGINPPVQFNEGIIAIAIPLVSSIVLFVVILVYFTQIMEVD
ncbi:MAG: ABC transporter permease subunit [Candidatus Bathyarchaeota archaeon]|nr:MAG: ABC transporter permease subunit [Candidatus Bathyarchaeota archaeon]